MKTILVAINAKYIHSNLAVYDLFKYSKEYKENIVVQEYTINHHQDYILAGIYKEKPDIVAFSCYIWNINIVNTLMIELKKLLPQVKIWLGGPEVSYEQQKIFETKPEVDLIMVGEGEMTFYELQGYYVAGKGKLSQIRGIIYRDDFGKINYNSEREVMDLTDVPFVYDHIEDFNHRIIYYESSRGCPYRCSYCLSSLDKKMRFRDLNLVKAELLFFLQHKVPQIKFVDRTFNAKPSHAMAIWEFIKEHDNGITNFHFEIAADLMTEEELKLLQTCRPGLIQLEIGVQSTNIETIKAIHRHMDFERLSKVSRRIKSFKNIHQHLDLIVGLPFEDYGSFEKSFADVYQLHPNQLQLGFLKVLKGSDIKKCCEEYGILYRDYAPYEVLKTDYLTFDEVLRLKDVEEMVEIYYNSGQFCLTIRYLEHFFSSPLKLYEELSEFYRSTGIDGLAHSRIKRYEILRDYFIKKLAREDFKEKQSLEQSLFEELLVFDLYLRENLKSRPSFSKDDTKLKKILRDFYFTTGRNRSTSHIEEATFDMFESVKQGKPVKRHGFYLFDYEKRNVLDYSANVEWLESLQEDMDGTKNN